MRRLSNLMERGSSPAGTMPSGEVTLKDGRKGNVVGRVGKPIRFLIVKTDDGEEVEVSPKDVKADLWLPTESTLGERGGTARPRSARMREIAVGHGRDLGITADATTGDWGLEQGREFDVRFHGTRFDIPDEAREKLGERGVDDEIASMTEYHLETFVRELKAKHKWVGKVGMVGRGPGWLVIEDASRGADSSEAKWDAVHAMVEKAFGALVADINNPDTWKEVMSARDESVERQRRFLW